MYNLLIKPSRVLNLLDQKWLRTWCRIRESGIKKREACWIVILWGILLVADSHIWIAKCDKSLLNYCHALQFHLIWACDNAFTLQESCPRLSFFVMRGYLRSQANLVAIWRELCKHHEKCMRKIMQCVWAWVMCKMRVSHTQCMKIENLAPWLHLTLLCDFTSLALSLHSSFSPFHSVCCASWVCIAYMYPFPINVICFFVIVKIFL